MVAEYLDRDAVLDLIASCNLEDLQGWDYEDINPEQTEAVREAILWEVEQMESVQPTLYGYNVEHLELIARVLQKENLPPERVIEALTDIGRIVAIVKDEFEEALIWDAYKDSTACSECGHLTLIEYDYCPACGACMKPAKTDLDGSSK